MKTNTFITLSTATANIGVLVGLVFLIFELRQTSTIALSQMTQQRALSYIDQNVAYAPDHEFSELMARVYKQHDFDSVTKKSGFKSLATNQLKGLVPETSGSSITKV